ncbi:MAG: IS1595 family transposase [Lentisphaeraceae bacterium]|nr:IS1595 family transposase [Lentisphaeraceae bacterium]
MSKNKIQFQTGLSLVEFNELYLSEEACCRKVQEMRWPQGFCCDKCKHGKSWKFKRGHKSIFQCKNCRHQSSLTAGTIFENTQLPLTKWFMAIHLISQCKNSVSALELHRQLQVNYKTAWLMKHKLMELMFDADLAHKLCGKIQVEDTFLGGIVEDGAEDRKLKKKAPVIAAIQVDEKGYPLYAKFTPVCEFNESSIEKWAQANIQNGSHCVTNESDYFNVLDELGTHEIHRKKKNGTSVFYWVNTILGNVRTSLSGTFHSVNFYKYGFRYLADLQFRFNRRFKLKQLFYSLIKKAAHHQPCPRKYLESVGAG